MTDHDDFPDEEPEDPDAPPADPRAARDEVLIECLAVGLSYPRAAEFAGCTDRTVSRRMADPEFARRVAQRRGERVRALTGQLTSLAEDAVTALRRVLADGERDGDVVRAAQIVFTFLGHYRTETDLEDRLVDLEQRAGLTDDNEEAS